MAAAPEPSPQLLRLFALFLWIRLFALAASYALRDWLPKFGYPVPWQWPIDSIAIAALPFIFMLLTLYWPWCRRALGKWLLPALIVISSIALLYTKYVALTFHGTPLPHDGIIMQNWRVFAMLIPLLLFVSWSYSFRIVVLFCIGTTALDAYLTIPLLTERITASFYIGITLIRNVIFLLIGYIIVWLLRKQQESQQALEESHRRLQAANHQLARNALVLEQMATTRERHRLAHDLHDTLSHSLSAMTLQLEASRSLWDDQAGLARQYLDNALQTARHGIGEARRALAALRASDLELQGLAEALRTLASKTAEQIKLSLDMKIPEKLELGDEAMEQCIYRVAQETMTNIVRHSEADKMTVSLEKDQNTLRLHIADNGRGFSLAEVDQNKHYGLLGLKERVAMLGGRLEIHSTPGNGTNVALEIDL